MAKFCRFEAGEEVPHDYGDRFFEEVVGQRTRLMIGPSNEHIDLLAELASLLGGGPWKVLYVFLVPRMGKRDAGRYESPPFPEHQDLAAWLRGSREFFEGDARHSIWVGSMDSDGLLVYDRHNVIFAYGPTTKFRAVLERRGYVEAGFEYPVPHAHRYHPDFDSEEDRLMASLDWRQHPLQPSDD